MNHDGIYHYLVEYGNDLPRLVEECVECILMMGYSFDTHPDIDNEMGIDNFVMEVYNYIDDCINHYAFELYWFDDYSRIEDPIPRNTELSLPFLVQLDVEDDAYALCEELTMDIRRTVIELLKESHTRSILMSTHFVTTLACQDGVLFALEGRT